MAIALRARPPCVCGPSPGPALGRVLCPFSLSGMELQDSVPGARSLGEMVKKKSMLPGPRPAGPRARACPSPGSPLAAPGAPEGKPRAPPVVIRGVTLWCGLITHLQGYKSLFSKRLLHCGWRGGNTRTTNLIEIRLQVIRSYVTQDSADIVLRSCSVATLSSSIRIHEGTSLEA